MSITRSHRHLALPLSFALVLTTSACIGSVFGGDSSGGERQSSSSGAIAWPEGFQRRVLVEHLADPDALPDGDRVVFTGTGDTRTLPFYALSAAGTLSQLASYDPSAADPEHDYCMLWAPDLTKVGTSYFLLFTGRRVPKGEDCAGARNKDQAIFLAEATSSDLAFGAAVPMRTEGGPYAKESRGCPSEGCDHALRIDAAAFVDGSDIWLAYTWFRNGNHNATINLEDPTTIIHNTDPSQSDEEGINEAPEFFKRAGRYYFLYSTGDFRGGYRLRYLMGGGVPELTKAQSAARELTHPAKADSGKYLETHGHGTIFAFRGQHYAIYHVGEFHQGNLRTRHTALSQVRFKGDGTLSSLTQLDLSWERAEGYEYSLDVRHEGSWIGPCVDAGRLRGKDRWSYRGVCRGDTLAPLGEIDRVRLCHAPGGDWTKAVCREKALPDTDDALHFAAHDTNALPSAPVSLQNEHSGRCLDIDSWSRDDGANLMQFRCHGGANQRFSLDKRGDAYLLRNSHSERCLDVVNWSKDKGANVIQYRCTGGANQLFYLEKRGEAYALKNKHSGLCLDVLSWSKDDGANILQFTCHGGANQLFTLVP